MSFYKAPTQNQTASKTSEAFKASNAAQAFNQRPMQTVYSTKQSKSIAYNSTISRVLGFFKICWWDESFLKKITYYIKTILFCYVLVCGIYYFAHRPIFYVPHIKIVTNGLEIPEKQKQKIMDQLAQPVHFFQQMQPFVDIFNEVSAIRSINYQRKFNSLMDEQENSLQLTLEKHQPFAKWYQDDYSYISTQGLIYQDFSMPQTQLQLSGDESTHILIKMIQNQATFKNILAPFTIKKVDFKFNIWHIELNQGITLTFSDEPIDDLKNRINRWKIIWNYWQKTNSPYKTAVDFDLRQNNGFSFKDINSEKNLEKNIIQDVS